MSLFNSSLIAQSLSLTKDYLTNLATSPQGKNILKVAFGNSFDLDGAIAWLEAESQNNYAHFPTIEIVNASAINHAYGAYAADTNTIYLSSEYIAQNANNDDAIKATGEIVRAYYRGVEVEFKIFFNK